MAAEMKRVEIKPGDIRRVNPRDMDTFMEMYPGAKVLDGDMPDDEMMADEPEAKAKKPVANKAVKQAEDK